MLEATAQWDCLIYFSQQWEAGEFVTSTFQDENDFRPRPKATEPLIETGKRQRQMVELVKYFVENLSITVSTLTTCF